MQFRRIDENKNHIIEIRVQTGVDKSPDTSYLEQDEFKDRLDAYRAEEFTFIGLQAKATIALRGVIQTIFSGGVFGVESDSDAAHLKDLAKEEIVEISTILEDLRFTPAEITEKLLEF